MIQQHYGLNDREYDFIQWYATTTIGKEIESLEDAKEVKSFAYQRKDVFSQRAFRLLNKPKVFVYFTKIMNLFYILN